MTIFWLVMSNNKNWNCLHASSVRLVCVRHELVARVRRTENNKCSNKFQSRRTFGKGWNFQFRKFQVLICVLYVRMWSFITRFPKYMCRTLTAHRVFIEEKLSSIRFESSEAIAVQFYVLLSRSSFLALILSLSAAIYIFIDILRYILVRQREQLWRAFPVCLFMPHGRMFASKRERIDSSRRCPAEEVRKLSAIALRSARKMREHERARKWKRAD